MSHTVFASIAIPLPDEPQAMATTLSEITAAWASLLKEIEDLKAEAKLSISETRARGTKRGRKPRIAAVPATEEAA